MVRKIAYESLKAILMQSAYANLQLQKVQKECSRKDAALLTQLVYGTLQHYDELSYQWAEFKQRSVKKKFEILINMSVYQILYLDRIPHYAIVNEACDLARPELRSFVQAILMKCIEQKRRPLPETDKWVRLQLETSIPMWILKLWQKQFGDEKAVSIAHGMMNDDYTLVARVNPIKADLQQMKQDTSLRFIDEWALTSTENLIESDYFKNGEIVIQDYSSQQVAKTLAPQKGERILDCCSAPGTKTGMIAAMMENCGEIVACDLHEHRVELVQKSMEQLGVTIVHATCSDSTMLEKQFEQEWFDRILCDVPCSGLGTIKNKPDLKFRIQPEDLDAIIQTQAAILKSAAKVLKPQGTLVYSTCTLNKKENERQIEQFIIDHPEFECVEEKTFFPDEGLQDGFYMAKLLKKASDL